MPIKSFWFRKSSVLLLNSKKSLKYASISLTTLTFDISLLSFLLYLTDLKVFFLSGVTFFIAVSLDYLLVRKFIFHSSKREMGMGYVYFLIIALSGSIIVSGLMYYSVEILGYYYLGARLIVAIFSGLWNYSWNVILNFRN